MSSRSLSWGNKTVLSDTEKVYVAIAYNCGHADPSRGFKQGFESDGRYYGENIFEYMRLAHQCCAGAQNRSTTKRNSCAASAADAGRVHRRRLPSRSASTRGGLLSKPRINKRNPAANVIVQLPAGQMMIRVSGKKGGKFFEVQTNLNGAHLQGFVAAAQLQPVKVLKAIPVVTPAPAAPPPESWLFICRAGLELSRAVSMPRDIFVEGTGTAAA